MGMTDAQFKAMQRDELENWKRVKEAAEEEHAEKTAKIAQNQIDIINEKNELLTNAGRPGADCAGAGFEQ